jgi:hypothetical protein
MHVLTFYVFNKIVRLLVNGNLTYRKIHRHISVFLYYAYQSYPKRYVTRQAMYVKCKIVVRSSNIVGKAISITHSVCVFVALRFQHEISVPGCKIFFHVIS